MGKLSRAILTTLVQGSCARESGEVVRSQEPKPQKWEKSSEDTIKWTNTHCGNHRRKKGAVRFEELMAESFPDLRRDISTHAQRVTPKGTH